MPAGTLDDQYLTWLYGQVAEVKTRKSSRTYWDLLRQLYSIEFVWFVPNDDNRAEDGRELRSEWAAELGELVNPEWLSLGCSFLEMLIALSRRLAFEAEGDTSSWFWHLLNNMELLGFNDRSHFSEQEVEDRTSTVIWRTYGYDGNGGMFPLRNPNQDQRKTEIWYQLSEYLLQDE
jgi:hypothetical protein